MRLLPVYLFGSTGSHARGLIHRSFLAHLVTPEAVVLSKTCTRQSFPNHHYSTKDTGNKKPWIQSLLVPYPSMDLLTCCLGGRDRKSPVPKWTEIKDVPATEEDAVKVANDVVNLLYNSEKSGKELKEELDQMVEVDNLKQRVKHRIAKAIVSAMDKTIRTGRKMSSPVREAFNKASDAADVVGGFVKSHPVFCTVIAFGVLALLLPWVLEAIGFAELGPIEGSWAARWQSTYNGVVPKDSLFSFFQRLGMVWHHRSPFGSEIHGVMDSIWDSWMKLLTEQSSSSSLGHTFSIQPLYMLHLSRTYIFVPSSSFSTDFMSSLRVSLSQEWNQIMSYVYPYFVYFEFEVIPSSDNYS